MTSDTAPNFVSHGTVWSFDFFEFNGERHDGMCSAAGPPNIKFETEGKELFLSTDTFYILEDGNGRYALPNGTKFDVYYYLQPK